MGAKIYDLLGWERVLDAFFVREEDSFDLFKETVRLNADAADEESAVRRVPDHLFALSASSSHALHNNAAACEGEGQVQGLPG